MPQLSGQVTVHRCQLGEGCILCCCSRHEIYKGIFHFSMLDIVPASISCHSSRLLDLLPVQVSLLKLRLEPHPCEIISRNTLPHAIRMCIFLHRKNFGDAHVCKLPIGKW